MDPQTLTEQLDRMEHALADASPQVRAAVMDVIAQMSRSAQVLMARLDTLEARLHWIVHRVSPN